MTGTAGGSVIGYIADGSYTATEGSRIAVFNGGGNTFDGTLSQTFATTPGDFYTVTLDAGIFGVSNGLNQRLQVSVDGSSNLLTETTDLTSTANVSVWLTDLEFGFIADGTTATLTLSDASGSLGGGVTGSDLLLDNVRIASQAVRTLTVASDPSAGVAVTVGTADLFGDSDGTTEFTRHYADGESVTLTAPATFGGGNFLKWQKDGVDYSTNASDTVTMDGDFTMTALYDIAGAPVAVADSYSTDEDVPLVVPASGVLANDTDPGSLPLTAVEHTPTSDGTLVLNSDGSFTYTPDADFSGTDSFTYFANNGTVNSNTVTP